MIEPSAHLLLGRERSRAAATRRQAVDVARRRRQDRRTAMLARLTRTP